ncbi:MAG: ribonuclease III [Planctomycetota bacterium]|jgi:ribonuclease-3
MDEEVLQQVEQIIEYKFSNRNFLSKALTHSSSVDNRLLSNERLEFLGDAILSAVICQTLFERFPGYLEGDLTKVKSTLVSRRTCARIVRQFGLQKFVQVGKGMASSRALSSSVSASVLETIIAAIYIDGGFEAAGSFILRIFASLLEQVDAKQSQGNFKSLLQQYAQRELNTTPFYDLLDEKGPDHDKCFESEVIIAARHFPSAWGTNKKEAEQKAAFNALVELEVLENTSQEHDS